MCVNVPDTMLSLEKEAKLLEGVYKLQSAVANESLNHDCTTFDEHGVCFSAGGRYTQTDSPKGSSAGAVLAGSYRISENFRLGMIVDQSFSTQTPATTSLSNGDPLFGLFGVWQERNDGIGAKVRLAASTKKADLRVTRSEINPSGFGPGAEAGSGVTKLNSEAASLVANYGFAVSNEWLATPYLGLRHTKINANSYTENNTISQPLSFDQLNVSATTLLAGVRFSGNLNPKSKLEIGLGLEQDVHNNTPVYSATNSGLAGLTAINFGEINKTRPGADLGLTYGIDKTQAVKLGFSYRQEMFKHSESTSVLATYSLGF
jgi:uncharacterized protein YhjY with autotransporter beta-barrel domain